MAQQQRAVEVVVRGRVQGVFFRASTRDRARAQHVVGWVRNDPGGTVTAHLEGARAAVEDVLGWIRGGGPPHAHVTHVDVAEVAPRGLATFEVTG